MATKQELIDGIEAAIAAGATVVDSVVQLVTNLVTAARDSIDDKEELRAILDSYEAQANRLAAAVATGTAAEDEEPVENDTVSGGEDDGDLGGEPAGDEA